MLGRVRMIVDKNGEPLFCGKDVCEALEYRKPDVTVRQYVSTHDALKQGVRVACGKKADGSPAMKSIQMYFVNESGLYSLVFGSKLESAERGSRKMLNTWVSRGFVERMNARVTLEENGNNGNGNNDSGNSGNGNSGNSFLKL